MTELSDKELAAELVARGYLVAKIPPCNLAGRGNYDQRHVVSLYLADAVLPVVKAAYAPLLDELERLRADNEALRESLATYLLTHVAEDETAGTGAPYPWQVGHNYAMREAARLIREKWDLL